MAAGEPTEGTHVVMQDTSKEMLEALQEDPTTGAVTGTAKPVLRDVAHREGILHRAAHLWLTNENGMVLVQRRSIGKESFPGYWDVSAAGHVPFGVTSLQTAATELQEELGITLPTSSIAFLFSHRVSTVSDGRDGGKFVNCEVQDVYWCRVTTSELEKNLRLDPVEVAAVRWAHPKELVRAYGGRLVSSLVHILSP